MKKKIIQLVLEAAGILLSLFGALSIVIALMPWINPGLVKANAKHIPQGFDPFPFFGGFVCCLIGLYCSYKAKKLDKK
jgi:hypothetical protein